jgi:hypothetical protein
VRVTARPPLHPARSEDSDGFTRDNFDAVVSNFTHADTYWPAFQQTTRTASPRGVMCSYVS